MLAITRGANLVFLWLLLFYAMRLGHAIGGAWAGRWSVMLLGFEPNFLAHTSLATTDLSLAACLTIFVYYFREGPRARLAHGAWRIPGVIFALPLLAKASAVVFGPLAMVLVELERLSRTCRVARTRRNSASRLAARAWRADLVAATRRGLRRDGLTVFAIGFALAMLFCWTGGYGSFQTTLANMPMDNPDSAGVRVVCQPAALSQRSLCHLVSDHAQRDRATRRI